MIWQTTRLVTRPEFESLYDCRAPEAENLPLYASELEIFRIPLVPPQRPSKALRLAVLDALRGHFLCGRLQQKIQQRARGSGLLHQGA